MAADDPVQGDAAIAAAFANATPAEIEAAAAVAGGSRLRRPPRGAPSTTARPRPPSSSRTGRRSAATSRAGAAAARSSSSATAPTEMAADGPRPGDGRRRTGRHPRGRVAALAERLPRPSGSSGADGLVERRAELEQAASAPGPVGRRRPRPRGDHRPRAGHRGPRAARRLAVRAAVRRRDPLRAHAGGGRRVAAARGRGHRWPTSTAGSGRSSCGRCSPASTTTATPWPRSTPGAGGTDAQDWAEMMLRMYTRWAERRGFTIEVEEATEGQEAGLMSATFIVRGRYAFGLLAAERGVHRLVRISPVRRPAPAPDQLRLARRGAVPGGRVRRGRDRREGPPHRHLPVVGRRRPARQQDRLGGAPHPPARPASW